MSVFYETITQNNYASALSMVLTIKQRIRAFTLKENIPSSFTLVLLNYSFQTS
jgi:hypothetical protein